MQAAALAAAEHCDDTMRRFLSCLRFSSLATISSCCCLPEALSIVSEASAFTSLCVTSVTWRSSSACSFSTFSMSAESCKWAVSDDASRLERERELG